MPYVWTEPELALEHRGVSVYHVYRNEFMDSGRREYWYTTDVTENQGGFDIRDLDCYKEGLKHEDVLKLAIEGGEITALSDE